jgi:hypothetical protein
MWNLNDDVIFILNFVAFVLKTIINAVWNTKIFFIFSLIQVVFAKFLEDFRTRFFWTMLITFIRELIFFDVNTFNEAFSVSKSSFDNFDEFEQRKFFFWKRNIIFFVQWLIFSRKINHFFVWSFFSKKKSRYLDCNKIVNRRWFRRWCIIKRKQLRFFWWWDFFFHHRFRNNILFKIIQNEFSYWNSVVLLFIAVFKYLHENRTIRYIKFSFFFLKKICFFVRIEKLRLIEDNVAIIIHVVFLWISDLKDIDEVIFYQIFDECSRFHFFTSFECIYFF